MEITVKIEAPALVDAVNSLAMAVAGNMALILSGANMPSVQIPVLEPVGQANITGIIPGSNAQIVPPEVPQMQPQPITQPMAAGVPTTIPTVPQQIVTTPGEVPTTVQTYSMEQLAVAATQLVDAGRRNDLIGLLGKYGVQALTALPKEQYGAFATDLRAMGAKI